MVSKNKFEVVNNEIHITRDDWSFVGMTTYREDYYDELSSKTWGLTDKGYITNRAFGMLHRYIMGKWYGESVLKDMTQRGYVVDHMNNIHHDCRISNLEFLKKAYNTAKGQAFDVDSKRMNHQIALNIFKDFTTGFYQITIGCNDSVVGIDSDGRFQQIGTLKFLFNCDYSIVINDAESILRQYETERIIDITKVHCCDLRIKAIEKLIVSEEEKQQSIIVRDGKAYLNLSSGKAWLNSVHFDEGWKP